MKTLLLIPIAILIGLFLIACVYSVIYTARAEKTYPAASRFVEVNGATVHLIDRGTSGPVVMMIHGASANAQEFAWTLAPRLEEHAPGLYGRPARPRLFGRAGQTRTN